MGNFSPKFGFNSIELSNFKFTILKSAIAIVLVMSTMAFLIEEKNDISLLADPVITRTVINTQPCYDTPDYAFYMSTVSGDRHFRSTEGTFIEYDDGTALLQMHVVNVANSNLRFDVETVFSGRTFVAPSGSPKSNSCDTHDSSDWYYYNSTQGTLTGAVDYAGAIITFERMGPAFQLGFAANVTDITGNFGGSGWLNLTIQSQPTNGTIELETLDGTNQGDFNINLSGDPFPPCVNVTSGGEIQAPDNVCPSYNDPEVISSVSLPQGGSGDLEYLWLSSTQGCPTTTDDFIPGANNSTYNPGPITATTWYIRCSRRVGCDLWEVGESNCVKIEVTDNCGDPAPDGWTLTCEDDQSVEILGQGIRCLNSVSFDIPNPQDVIQVVAEVIYKGTTANPSQLTIRTNAEMAIVSAEYTIPANAYYFRTTFGSADKVILETIPNACQAQSILLYVFRTGGQTTASTGHFVQTWLYHNSYCEILEIPTAPAVRDVEIKVPLSEITTDGRIAIVRAEVVNNPSTFAEVIVDDINMGDALHIATLVLQGVAPLENKIEICVESPYATADHPNGQSLVYSGAIKADPECKTCADSDLAASAEVISNYNGAEISCTGANDGRLQGLVFGGVPPFVYTWSNGDSGQIISDVAPGDYTVTITDQFGCTAASATVTIDEPQVLSAEIDITSNYNGSPISCNGANDASLTVVAVGGTGNYTYQWGASAGFSTSQSLSNLTPGTYEVLVSDMNGCTTSESITISEPEVLEGELELITNFNDFNISCAGASDGIIAVSAIGGTAPYIYNWSNGGNQNQIENLGPGNFGITVTDQNGCQFIKSTTLTEPAPLDLTVQINSNYNGFNVSCFGGNDGSIISQASGGTGLLTYLWSTGDSDQNLDNLIAGTYTLTVVDENQCSIQKEVTLTQPTELIVESQIISNYNSADISCAGANDGRAEVLVSGALAPYTISWSNGENTQIISDLAPGIYDVTVTELNGCFKTSSVTIAEPEELSCAAQITSSYFEGVAISSQGGSDGSASVVATGGTGTLTYQWDDPAAQTTSTLSNLPAGTYNVVVADVNGCNCLGSVTLEDPAKVGDQIFVDLNANGIFDAGEPGLADVNLILTGTANDGTPVTRTLTTDANGNYIFDGLLPGDYKITIDLPQGFQLTALNIGANEAIDSDFDPDMLMTDVFTLDAGDDKDDVDGGIFQYAKIGDYAWIDCNKDGMQDAGESPLADLEVTLSGTNGLGESVSLSTQTDQNGKYEFLNLVPGDYKLTFGIPSSPTGLTFTEPNQGADTDLDSDIDPLTGMTLVITFVSGDNFDDVDAGYIDSEAPILIGIPQNENVSCDAVPLAPETYIDVTATDNLDQNVEIIFSETSTQGAQDDCSYFEYQIVREWIARDDCGNESIRTQTINVSDQLAPELSGVPTDITIECSLVPGVANPTAFDNCDDNLQINFVEQRIDGTCAHDYKLIRTWSVTDQCGNSTTEYQEIVVQDTQGPEFMNVPSSVTVDCSGIPAVVDPTVIDNCSLDLDFEFVEKKIEGSCQNEFSLVRSWTAVDECGNETRVEQEIIVSDNELPVLSGVPADITLSCEEYAGYNTPNVTVTDNCTDNIQIDFVEEVLTQTCANSFELILTWSAVDECGNSVTETQLISVFDEEKPVLSGVPADITLSCEEYAGYSTPTVTVSDNCTQTIDIDFVEEVLSQDCDNTFKLKLSWSATDECGNSITENQFITVEDNEEPVLSGVPADVRMSCKDFENFTPAQVTASDNCTPDILVELVQEILSQECVNSFELKLSWTATDPCGNSVTETQLVTVSDNDEPVLSGVPADVTLSCMEYSGYQQALVTVSDNCTIDIDVDFVEEVLSQECENTFKLKLTWSAEDECGNSVSESQYITVADNEEPVLSGVPADVTLSCADYSEYPQAQVTVSDNCTPDIDIDFVEEVLSQECANTFKLKLTWSAEDECGNSISESQYITVADNEEPVLSGVPADVTLSCADYSGYPQAQVTVSDNCTTDIDVDFVEEVLSQECANTFKLKLTWSAEDECGNSISESQYITVADNEEPVLSGVPADVTLSCADYSGYPQAQVTVSDNCTTDIDVDFVEEVLSQECANTFKLKLTWSAEDECGNSISESQYITVADNEEPVLSGVPADVTLSCADYSGYPQAQVTVSDNCTTDIDVDFVEEVLSQECANTFKLKLTWSAEDECGNSTSETQLVTVSDDEAPVISGVPADIIMSCEDYSGHNTALVTAEDNCTADIQVSFIEQLISQSCANAFELKLSWTAVDECGNSTTESQMITVTDDTDPVLFGVPDDLNSTCDELPIDQPIVRAEDNCSQELDVQFSEEVIPGNCDHSYTLIRTWSVEDECGNTASESQNIIVSDDLSPILESAPADVTVSCEDIPAPVTLYAEDDCIGSFEANFVEQFEAGDCANSFVLIRTWSASDACGNQSIETRKITVEDNQAPVILGVPVPLTIACGNDDNIPFPTITVEDNCDQDVQLDYSERMIPGNCPNTYLLIRTWEAIDACGNESSESQRITVEDDIDPILSGVSADITVSCGQIPAASQVTAHDDCQGQVNVYLSETSQILDCPGNYIISRTWTATDACGNQTSETQKITVDDVEAPVLSATPADITVNLSNGDIIPDAAIITADDECDDMVDVHFEEIESPGSNCGYIITRTWTAEDDCNNEVSHTQSITVLDQLSGTLEPGQTTICAGEEQVFTVQVSGSGYTFSWDATGGYITPNGETAIFSSDDEGVYIVQVTVLDGTGCQIILKSQIIVNQPIQGEANSNSPVCGGSSLTLFASGGTEYLWTGPNNFGSTDQNPEIQDAAIEDSGLYIVEISNGACSVSESINVNVGEPLIVDYSVFQPECGEMGIINVGVLGGSGAISFLWSDQTIPTDSGHRDDLIPGQYSVTVSDELGCTEVLSELTIEDNCACDAFAGTLTATNPDVCIEGGSAEISAVPVGDAIVPAGFETVYVLTIGSDLVILEASENPIFTVNQPGTYTIHTLVFDPNDLDLSIIQFGITTGFDVLSLLTQGAGDICGNLDTEGVTISVIRAFAQIESNQPEFCDEGNGQVVLSPDSYTYSWSDGGQGAIRADLTDGFYLVTGTSPEGCEVLINVMVLENCGCIEPQVSDILIFESHCGFDDGSATIIPSGNISDYNYSWSTNSGVPNGIGNSRSGLAPGVYEVTISDDNFADCQTVVELTVGTVDGPVIEAINIENANCNASDGSVSFLPQSYTYIWEHDGQIASSRSDLSAGFYNVILVDVNTPPCTDVITIEVAEENTLEAEAIIIENPDCGNHNGSVEIEVSNGSGNYQFFWNDQSSWSSPLRTHLPEGAYEVLVLDNNTGCSQTISFGLISNVSEAAIEIFAVQNETCVGTDDGYVNYDYTTSVDFVLPARTEVLNIEGVVVGQDQLAAGEYFIHVYDGNGCLAAYSTFEIVEAIELIVEVGIIDQSCNDDGKIELTVSGGTPGYSLDWSDLPGQDDVQNRNNLSSGIYSVVVKDSEGCTLDVLDIQVDQNCNSSCIDPIIANVVVIESNCDENTGSIILEMVGNNDDYDYSINPVVGVANGNSFSTLSAGIYEITISDPNYADCFITQSVIVNNAHGPAAQLVNTSPALCGQNNGAAVMTPFTFTYEWCNGVVDFNPNNLPAGICYVTITDPSTGCSNIMEVEIPELNTLDAIVTINNLPECGASNGSVTINAIGGSGAFTYSWNDGSTGKTRTDLPAGAYTVLIADLETGCSTTYDFGLSNQIQGAVDITINSTLPISTSCSGVSDGFLLFDLTPDADFQGPAQVVVQDQNGVEYLNGRLPEGAFCLLVYDAIGCLANSECFDVISPSEVNLDLAIQHADCDENGSIILEAFGGTPGYTFDWADVPGNDDPKDRTDLLAGTYSITVTDSNGCQAFANNLLIDNNCAPCGTPDIVTIELPVNSTEEYCFELEDCMDPSQVTYILDNGGYIGSSDFGNWELAENGCLIYHSFGDPGMLIDEICIYANDGTYSDTTCVQLSIIDNPLSGPMIDTIYVSTTQDVTFSDCLNTDEIGGMANGSSAFANVDDGIFFMTNLECFTYIPNTGITGLFLDTATVVLCNSLIPACDTTVIIFSILPVGGCEPIFNQMDETVSTSNCSEGVDYCLLGFSPAELELLSLYDNGNLLSGPYTDCGVTNSVVNLSIGDHELVIVDTLVGCLDTLNVSVTCDSLMVIDTLIIVYEGTTGIYCFDLPVVNSLENLCPTQSDGNTSIEMLTETSCINIEPLLFGNDDYCFVACDTLTGLCQTVNLEILVLPVIDTIYETINLGFTDTICLDTSLFQNQLNSFINDCENPDNLNVDFSLDLENYCITYTGDLIGQDTACLLVCDAQNICDTTILIVNVIVPTPDTLTIPVMLGSTDTLCLDGSELNGPIVTISNICSETVGENISLIVDPTTNCIFFEGLEIGQDTACMVICDADQVCDTTYIFFDVFSNQLPIAVNDDTTTTIGNSVVIEVLLNDTINGNLEGFEIVTNPLHGTVIINPDGTITYVPNENFCGGLDSFMYSITNEFGSDTATVTIEILCQELIIFSGFSPNGDGINDVFNILGIENFPGNEVCVFNRWGNRVHLEKGYRNDRGWGGTWNGKDLPDGTYFYVVDDGEGNTYSGYLQIHR